MRVPVRFKASVLELAKLLPGYVGMYVRGFSECWSFSAGEIKKQPLKVQRATITKIYPLSPYTLEIFIEGSDNSDN